MDTYTEKNQEWKSAITNLVIAAVAVAALVGAVVFLVSSGLPGFEGWFDTDQITRYTLG